MYSTKSNTTFTLRSSTSDSTSAIGTYLKDKLPTQPAKISNEPKMPSGLAFGNYMYWDNGKWKIGSEKIVMGANSGQTSQGSNAIAIGIQSGQTTQGEYSISTGYQCGQYKQGKYAIAIGQQSAQQDQKDYAVSIGFQSGQNNQSNEAIAIGAQAGQTSQSQGAVSIGFIAGQNYQGTGSVALGLGAGFQHQGGQAVASGLGAGAYAQGDRAIANGYFSGFEKQGLNAVAIGPGSAYNNQGNNSIAIGSQSGHNLQGVNSISIGNQAGKNNQGNYSIALGFQAGETSQGKNSIIINASGTSSTCDEDTFNVKPIKQTEEKTQSGILFWNPETSEIKSINGTKTFVINHPENINKYLVHACLEGPEAGVYYRGKGEIKEDSSFVDIYLPSYVKSLADDFSIHITPINSYKLLSTSEVELCNITNLLKFRVSSNLNGFVKFYWIVYGKRNEINVEPEKDKVIVKGDGPYKWI